MRWVETEMRDVNWPRMKESCYLLWQTLLKQRDFYICWDGLGHINEIEGNSMVQLKDSQI